MEKFVPYEKLSKKEKRKIDAARRAGWGSLSPVTRSPRNSRAYDRRKARNLEMPDSGLCIFRPGRKAPAEAAC